MTAALTVAALWMALALIAGMLSFWLRVSSPVVEIIIGMVAQLVIGADLLGTHNEWIKFFSVVGAILLTFLAGTEIDPSVLKLKWKQAGGIGFMSFFVPFGLCAGAANVYLGWGVMPSWLAGIAMSTTSAAVVYAVMLQFGLATTEFRQNDLNRYLRDRRFDGRHAWSHVHAVHDKDLDRSRGCCRGLGRAPVAHPSLLRSVRRPAFRARD